MGDAYNARNALLPSVAAFADLLCVVVFAFINSCDICAFVSSLSSMIIIGLVVSVVDCSALVVLSVVLFATLFVMRELG